MPASCHPLLKKTAEDMAQAIYEKLAFHDQWYKDHPDRNAYVEQVWPTLLTQARAILAKMLTGPYPETMKEQISEALIADRSLHRKPVEILWRN